jgi:hypothetical protein
MTAIEGRIRAELTRQAASLEFTPSDDAWSAITERAITEHAITERTRHRQAGHARNWLMVAGSAAAVVVTVLAGTFAAGVLGRPAHPAATPPAASGGTSGAGTKLPRGVVRIAPPSGQPGIVLYAWSVTYMAFNGRPGAPSSPSQISALPAGPPQLCVSDQPPVPLPASVPHPAFAPGSLQYDCPNAGFFTFRVDHTPRLGFPVAGGDAWVGSATSNIAEVEARYADGRVVRGSVFTIPGTSIRLWALGLPGPERLGSPLPGVRLVVRDIHGFAGQGTLSASLPNPFPFEVDGTATHLFKFGAHYLGALTFQGKYAVFGYQAPTGLAARLTQRGPDFYAVQQAYPLPASQPLQGQFGADPDFLHPWWFGVARADVAKIVVRLAGGPTMQATCPSPAPAAPPGRKPAVTPLTATCTALPGAPGRARVFAVQLPQDLYRQRANPQGTATAYNAAGEALATISLGTDWHP